MDLFSVWGFTFYVFVVSCDVLQSGEADGFGADEHSDSLSVFAEAEHLVPTLAHDDGVDVGIHLGIDKRDVVKQVDALVLDGFDRSWATAVHS